MVPGPAAWPVAAAHWPGPLAAAAVAHRPPLLPHPLRLAAAALCGHGRAERLGRLRPAAGLGQVLAHRGRRAALLRPGQQPGRRPGPLAAPRRLAAGRLRRGADPLFPGHARLGAVPGQDRRPDAHRTGAASAAGRAAGRPAPAPAAPQRRRRYPGHAGPLCRRGPGPPTPAGTSRGRRAAAGADLVRPAADHLPRGVAGPGRRPGPGRVVAAAGLANPLPAGAAAALVCRAAAGGAAGWRPRFGRPAGAGRPTAGQPARPGRRQQPPGPLPGQPGAGAGLPADWRGVGWLHDAARHLRFPDPRGLHCAQPQPLPGPGHRAGAARPAGPAVAVAANGRGLLAGRGRRNAPAGAGRGRVVTGSGGPARAGGRCPVRQPGAAAALPAPGLCRAPAAAPGAGNGGKVAALVGPGRGGGGPAAAGPLLAAAGLAAVWQPGHGGPKPDGAGRLHLAGVAHPG